MALSSTADYQLALNEVLFYLDQNFGGIDAYGLPIFSKIDPVDFATLMNAYHAYKQGRLAKPLRVDGTPLTDLYPAAHGANALTYTNGGNPTKGPTLPTTW